MPDSRSRRIWIPTLAALIALLAFAAQAGAKYEDENHVDACVSTGLGDAEYDPCSEEEKAVEEPHGVDDATPKPEPEPEEHDQSEKPKPEEPEKPAESEHADLPDFRRSFLNRVWKFEGEVDFYEEGELSMTLAKVLNLPRKFRRQDDELLDQDATVLVSQRVRVFEGGERVSRDELEDANDVRVHGKLLRPRQWSVDEDGTPVATIRAKKIYIRG